MPRMPCIMYSSMVRYLEDLPCLSYCRMNRPDIVATDRNLETQVAGEGVCVVGSVAECRARACRRVSRECGRGAAWLGVAVEGVSRNGGRRGRVCRSVVKWRARV